MNNLLVTKGVRAIDQRDGLFQSLMFITLLHQLNELYGASPVPALQLDEKQQ